MSHFLLKAAPGRRVRDPETLQPLEGVQRKPKSSFWLRRLAQGDVELAATTEQEKPNKKGKE